MNPADKGHTNKHALQVVGSQEQGVKNAIASDLASTLKVLMPTKTEADVRRVDASASNTSHAAVAREGGIMFCQLLKRSRRSRG